MIKYFFDKENGLYKDIEVIMHVICTAAIKVSVESNVESLFSRYETHFDKSQQLKEKAALEEMMIAENGPNLVHSDSLIQKSLNAYFKEHNSTDRGSWHFLKKQSRISSNTSKSQVLERMKLEKSKLSFMDE